MKSNITDIAKKNALLIICILLLLITYSIFILLFIKFTISSWKDTGNFGSLIGGILGPFSTALTGILLYFSLKEQRNTNEIVINNQMLQLMMDEARQIENNKTNDIKILTEIYNAIPTKEDELSYKYSTPGYDFETGESEELDEFKKLSVTNWLSIISIIRSIETCIIQSKEIEEFNSLPFIKINKIYVVDKYRPLFLGIKNKIQLLNSEIDERYEVAFIKRLDNIERLMLSIKTR